MGTHQQLYLSIHIRIYREKVHRQTLHYKIVISHVNYGMYMKSRNSNWLIGVIVINMVHQGKNDICFVGQGPETEMTRSGLPQSYLSYQTLATGMLVPTVKFLNCIKHHLRQPDSFQCITVQASKGRGEKIQ
uniref:Uncharacterized protein n=1 Tax=Rhizophora mucronata TaxID=61149 RepID=A0A2P2MVI2_RHIMU